MINIIIFLLFSLLLLLLLLSNNNSINNIGLYIERTHARTHAHTHTHTQQAKKTYIHTCIRYVHTHIRT